MSNHYHVLFQACANHKKRMCLKILLISSKHVHVSTPKEQSELGKLACQVFGISVFMFLTLFKPCGKRETQCVFFLSQLLLYMVVPLVDIAAQMAYKIQYSERILILIVKSHTTPYH